MVDRIVTGEGGLVPALDLSLLDPLVASLRRRPGVVGVALLGSFARGKPRPGSDLDLVVLTEGATPMRVEVFRYAGRAAEVLSVGEETLRAALDDPRRGARTIAIWSGGRVLHDAGGRLARLLAEVERRRQQGPPPPTDEERAYARFELAHARQLLADEPPEAAATLLTAYAVRTATELLLRHERRWPVGWRATLPALATLDPEAADLAGQALRARGADAVEAALRFLDRVQARLGGPLPNWTPEP